MILPELEQLSIKVKEKLENESSGHDMDHALRVYRTAMHLQKEEGGDPIIIGAAALVHDVCRPWEKETGKLHFGPEALEIIKKILIKSNIPTQKIKAILNVVAKHDTYDWTNKTEKSIELQIVQDADNLDAIGAIAIARTFRFGGAYNLPLYIENETLSFDHDYIEKPGERKSSIAHFYEKLLKLHKNLNTKTGKKIGQLRHEFMEEFLEQFFAEWNASK